MSESNETQEQPTKNGSKRPYARIVAACLIVIGAFFGVRHLIWARNHESTDNAQVAGDVVIVAPQVSGTVSKILFDDNALVKKGQVLIELDPARFDAAVKQAKANLEAAIADAQAAGVSVQYAAATTKASLTQASGGVSQAEAEIGAAKASVLAGQATLKGSQAQATAAQAQYESSKLDLKVAQDALARTLAAVDSAKAQVDWARSAVKQAQASVDSAKASLDLARKNMARTKALFDQGAESKQNLDSTVAGEKTAEAAYVSAQGALSMARASVRQRESDDAAAQAQLEQARSQVTQAGLKVNISKQMAESAKNNVDVARLQVSASESKVGSAVATKTSSIGQEQASEALNLNVTKLAAGQKQAYAKVEQAKAALASAELDLEHAILYAPCDGRVSKRIVDVGSLAQVGGAMVYIVPVQSIYVLANFKETQVAKMRKGDKVEIDVDGIPGKKFEGIVDSLSAATGSTFALLPPDNSTGNFVKVVQRIPVKVVLGSNDAADDRLRVGMSVVATVETR